MEIRAGQAVASRVSCFGWVSDPGEPNLRGGDGGSAGAAAVSASSSGQCRGSAAGAYAGGLSARSLCLSSIRSDQ
jgi:hypothetical protein